MANNTNNDSHSSVDCDYLDTVNNAIISLKIPSLDRIQEELSRVAQVVDSFNKQFRFDEISRIINKEKAMWADYQDAVDSLSSQNEAMLSAIKSASESFAKLNIPDEIITWYKINSKYRHLYNFGWLITPYLNNKLILNSLLSAHEQKMDNVSISNLYNDFFQGNNYYELKTMAEGWVENKYYAKRANVFKSCIFVIEKCGFNDETATAVLPTLIAQIDGILLDYARHKGYGMRKAQMYDFVNKKKINDHVQWMDNLPVHNQVSIYPHIFLAEYLFAKAYPAGQIYSSDQKYENPKLITQSVCYNRHKIMHGEDLSYGVADNILRTFLLLDYLAHLELN